MRCLLALVVAIPVVACGSAPTAPNGDDDATIDAGDGGDAGHGDALLHDDVFDPAVTDVVVEIDYETGQEPFTGPILGFGDTFDLTVANLDRLFASHKHLSVPRTLAEMQDIGNVADDELTVGDITQLAAQHRDHQDTPTTKTYYIVFVGGHFADEHGPNASILGVSIGNTGIVAIFKDVVRSTAAAQLPNLVRYVEQSTLVHELGHAIGLVDNGVAMVSPHRDVSNGSHCNDDQCVMYFANEGASGMVQYATDHVLANDSILFDAACLADVDAVNGAH